MALETEIIQKEIIIAASREEVFELLATPEKSLEWAKGLKEMSRVGSDSIGLGSQTRARVSVFGMEMDARGECVVFETPEKISIETTMGTGMKSRSDSVLMEQDGGTRLLASMSFERPGGVLGMVVGKFIKAGGVERDFEESLNNLKKLAETPKKSY